MPSESEGSSPPVQERPPTTIISSTNPTIRSGCCILKIQNFPSHLVHILFAKFPAFVLPLRQIRPPPLPRNLTGHSRRHAVLARDGVFVSPVREAPGGFAPSTAADHRSCCHKLRSFLSECWEILERKFLLFVSFVVIMSFALNYIRWMIWKNRGDKLDNRTV